jgi:hypothetical protein
MTQKILFSTVSALALALHITSSSPLFAIERVDDGDFKGAARAAAAAGAAADPQALVPAGRGRKKINSIQDVNLTAADQQLLTDFCLKHTAHLPPQAMWEGTQENFVDKVLRSLATFFEFFRSVKTSLPKPQLQLENFLKLYPAYLDFLTSLDVCFHYFRDTIPNELAVTRQGSQEEVAAAAREAWQKLKQAHEVAYQRGAGRENDILQDINRGIFFYFRDMGLIPLHSESGVIKVEDFPKFILQHPLLQANKKLRQRTFLDFKRNSIKESLVYYHNALYDDFTLYSVDRCDIDTYRRMLVKFGSALSGTFPPEVIMIHKGEVVSTSGLCLSDRGGSLCVQFLPGPSRESKFSLAGIGVLIPKGYMTFAPLKAAVEGQQGEHKFIPFPSTPREESECELALLEEMEQEILKLLQDKNPDNREKARFLLEALVPDAVPLLAPAQEAKEAPADKSEAPSIDETVARIKAEIEKQKGQYIAMIAAEQAKVTQAVADGADYLEAPQKAKKGNKKKKKKKGGAAVAAVAAATAAAAPARAQAAQGAAAAAKPQAMQNQGGGAAAAAAAQALQAQAFGNQGRVKFRALAKVLASHIKQLPLKDMRKVVGGSHYNVHLDGAQSASVVVPHKRPKDKTLPAAAANRVVNRFLESFMQHLSGKGGDS